ncbi:MAG: amidohydrolase family protein [Ruminococcaceae bacterium]|nr:amidohydrolase family protein [Oscillospiraceae bacterium]
MKVYEGTILTVDEQDKVAKYLVEDGGRIVFVGDELPKEYKKAKKVKLGKKALCPAFVDTHQHFASFALFHAGLNVMDAESNEQILEWAKEFAKRSKDKVLVAFGASPYSVKEGVLVNREQLDSVESERPFFLVKYDGHACVVNTALLNKVDKIVKNLRGYHPDTGEMNQEAFFAISDYISKTIPIPTLVKNMQKAIDYQVGNGIGMVHTVSGVGFPMDMDINLEKWFGRSLQHGVQMRVFSQTMDVKQVIRRGFPRVGGCFKCALDGCFGSADAALNKPYEGTTDDYGILFYDDKQVINFCKKANRAGLQIQIHAIGDRAFNQATIALKAALDDYPREDHRHGIIHACLPTKEGIQICKDYNINLPMQSAFIGWRQEPDEYLQKILGDRANLLNPLRDIWDTGILISAGSDGPCTNPDPIAWIDHAVNNSSMPSQSLTVKEALRMCTYNGYKITFDEKERGSLEVGKIADMVILSADPYSIPTKELGKLKVEETILGGNPYKKQNRTVLGAILRGMASKNAI